MKKQVPPPLSIITVSYNQGQFLEETICSVLDQGYPNLEYIIIDGGSTDDSVGIIQKYARHLAYWVSEPDRGQAHAINKGMERATGDIIGWINSDDTYVKGSFQRAATALGNNPDAIFVHGNRILIDENSRVIGWSISPLFDPEQSGYSIASETAFWRRTAATDLTFNESLRFSMDVDFFCHLYHKGRFINLDAYLGCFRCHGTSKTSTIGHVAKEEGIPTWKRCFGEDHEGWKIQPHVSRARQWSHLITHPFLIGLPYAYRRLILRQRGLLKTP